MVHQVASHGAHAMAHGATSPWRQRRWWRRRHICGRLSPVRATGPAMTCTAGARPACTCTYSPSDWWWRTPLALLGLLPTPAYPVPSAADADAFNWAAVDMLRQLVHLGGFRLLSHRVNSGAPHFNVSAPTMARVNGRPVPQFDRPKQMVMSCCQELLFAWKHPGHAN